MKNITVVLVIIISFISCGKDDSEVIRKELVTIHYDPQMIDNCIYIITTQNNEFFTFDLLQTDLRNDGTYKATISFSVLDEFANCGFSGSLQKIEVLSITEIKSL